MDHFDDVFHTFLGLDSVNYLAVNETVTSFQVFIQNIFVINDKIFILGWSNPLIAKPKIKAKINSVLC